MRLRGRLAKWLVSGGIMKRSPRGAMHLAVAVAVANTFVFAMIPLI